VVIHKKPTRQKLKYRTENTDQNDIEKDIRKYELMNNGNVLISYKQNFKINEKV